MKSVQICIEINGQQIEAGNISGSSEQGYSFTYDPVYLGRPDAAPLSQSLPLQEETFSPGQTRNFFEGLLPEGFTRKSVAQWLHESDHDYFSILSRLGSECLGAIQVIQQDNDLPLLKPRYRRLSAEEVKNLAREGAMMSAELVTKSHISLTGASGKAGLYFDSKSGYWFLPQGTAPSTHIVKQSHVRLQSIVANEQLSQMTAAKLGIEIPESFIINLGSGEDEDVLLATRRYDRIFDPGSQKIDGLPVPYRLHQEDFAQALGISADEKYETQFHGEHGYLPVMFRLIREASQNPLEDQLKLWDRIVFCFLLGNTDCHLKNFSLLYDKGLRSARLAPAYDMVSTAVYESGTRDMSFYIGDQLSLDELNENSFEEAAGLCRMNAKPAMRRFYKLADAFEGALKSSCRQLKEMGIPHVEAIRDKILLRGGFHRI